MSFSICAVALNNRILNKKTGFTYVIGATGFSYEYGRNNLF